MSATGPTGPTSPTSPTSPTGARSLLQVPEVCAYNPYVALQAAHLAQHGFQELRPGICLDVPEGAAVPVEPSMVTSSPANAQGAGAVRVVHLHWPEKLLATLRLDTVIGLLGDLRRQGAVLVRTHHNLVPHELRSDAAGLEQALAGLVDGHHCFSQRQRGALQERLGTAVGGGAWLVQGHPQYQVPPSARRRTSSLAPTGWHGAGGHGDLGRLDSQIVVGCFGRLRPYKRIVAFARRFAQRSPSRLRLRVAGLPQTAGPDAELRALTAACPAIDYHGGFLGHDDLAAALADVDYVVLPYGRLWSSGILVMAAQLGVPVLAPPPAMLDRSSAELAGIVVCLDPWDDDQALDWLQQHGCRRDPHPTPTTSGPDAVGLAAGLFPTWQEAASGLAHFYIGLASHRR